MCNGHGTHVAGIIAAQSKNPYGIVGAAQGVTLGSFRVFGCSGDVPNDILIAAFNKAYEAGADIITASVGGPSGWSEDPWSVAVSRIVENGVPCTVSAGNDGSVGLFFASTAANGKGVTAIASVDNTLAPALLSNATFSVDNGTDQSFGYTVGTPGNWSVTLPLWAASYNTSNPADGCDEYPDSTPDLSGYIVLVRRGTCTFVQKATNAIKKGAKYLMVYNNAVGTASIDATGSGLQGLAMVTSDVGEKWIGYLKNGSSVVVSVTDPLKAPKFLVNFPNNATGGLASIYTSWGPTFEVDVKPQIASPGGNILSTYPQALGSYAVLSGTSMACPLAAAVYALIMNVRGTKDPKTIENVLSATSKPVPFSNGELTLPYLAPVAQQGAGLLQAYDAAYATTLLSVSSLSFNDTAHFTPERNFTISNTGNKEVTYQLRHVGALTAYTYLNDSTIFPDTFPNELSETHANLSFAPSDTLTIPAGQRRIVSVTLTPPSGLDAKRLPVYSGYIAINGSDESLLSLPYLGVVGSLRESVVLDPNGTYLSDSLSEKHVATAANHTFLLPPAGHANDTAYANRTALPTLITSFAMGTALLRVDLIPVGPSNASNATTSTTLFGEASLGPVLSTPVEYTSRGSSTNPWDGSLSDGTYAPAGWYKFSVQTLRIFGNREVAADYDVVETVPFEIRYSSLASNVTRRWY
ncbi:hypothetical protein VTK73DRAFT_5791 [Phialemonium thermophilum]|uniref:Uncharacterized protein n=1 Tax=Phialemonium thermophilum TaxID=223376 RepID=A0ABR3WLP1_9PEZI